MGHVRMMAAVQPFLSGAISKTINLPSDATVEEVERIHWESWRLGVKAIALYRDGSKLSQPLSAGDKAQKIALPKDAKEMAEALRALIPDLTPEQAQRMAEAAFQAKAASRAAPEQLPAMTRRKLPSKRHGITQEAKVGGNKIFLRTGEYNDGTLGEIFIDMHKEGAALRSVMNCFAMLVSIALQYGVPLEVLCNKFAHTRFEPSGFTNNPQIPIAKSIMDYLFRWLQMRFLKSEGAAEDTEEGKDLPSTGLVTELKAKPAAPKAAAPPSLNEQNVFQMQADAPPCHGCGAIMVRSGSCYKCLNCGSTSGCS